MKIISKSLLMLFVVSAAVGTQANRMGARFMFGAKKVVAQVGQHAKALMPSRKVAAGVAVGLAAGCAVGDRWGNSVKTKVTAFAQKQTQNAVTSIAGIRPSKLTDIPLRFVLLSQSKSGGFMPFRGALTQEFLNKDKVAVQAFARLSTQDQATFNKVPYFMHDRLAKAESFNTGSYYDIGGMAAHRLEQPLKENERADFESFQNQIANDSRVNGQFSYHIAANKTFMAKLRGVDKSLARPGAHDWNFKCAMTQNDGQLIVDGGQGLKKAINLSSPEPRK